MKGVLLLGSPGFLDDASRALKASRDVRVVGATHDPAEALSLASDLFPDLAVVDQDGAGLDAGSALARRNPSCAVFLASDYPSTDLWRRAVSSGMRGIVQKPFTASDLLRAYEEAMAEEERRAPRAPSREEVSAPSGAVVVRQEVVCFWSPAGGTGKTTLSVSFAACYSRVKMTAVVADFDASAKLSYQLHLPPGPCLSDWLEVSADALDKRGVEALLLKHSSGLSVLPGARSMYDPALSEEVAKNVLEALTRYHDVVVVDLGQVPNDASVVALERASRIFAVGRLDIATLRKINESRDELEALGVDTSKVRFVMNRVPRRPDLPLSQVREYMAYPLAARIPEDPSVPVLQNRGEIPVLSRPDSPFSVEVRKLVTGVSPEALRPRPSGFLSRLLRR